MEKLEKIIFKKIFRIEGDDGRILNGKIKLIDIQGNIMIENMICEFPNEKISPINYKIENFFNSTPIMSDYKTFNSEFPCFKVNSNEELKKFMVGKFFYLGMVIKRVNIKKIFLLN